MFKYELPISKIVCSSYFIHEDKMLKILAFGLVIGSAAMGVLAQTFNDVHAKTNNSAYLQDTHGVIARSSDGLCWRTGDWTTADAMAGCDGQLAPPIAKVTAPAIATVPSTTVPSATVTTPVETAASAPKRCDSSVELANDHTFKLNKFILSSAAKNRIDDEVISKLAACSKIDVVIVTGHTDRLGSQQYNKNLSEKRAAAVAAYLKNKGTSADIEILGAGESQPVKACSDKLGRKKLIACLAPNRRVVIEIRGLAK